MTDINHEEMAAGAEEIWKAWKDFERRLLTLVEAMGHPQDRLVLEVGDSHEIPTVDFAIEGGSLTATIGDDHYWEHIPGREPIVHRAIMLLRNIAGIPHPHLLTHRAEGPCAQLTPVLGLAWTGGNRPSPDVYIETDREALVDLVEDALSDVYAVGRDEDDDVFLDHLGQRIWGAGAPGRPRHRDHDPCGPPSAVAPSGRCRGRDPQPLQPVGVVAGRGPRRLPDGDDRVDALRPAPPDDDDGRLPHRPDGNARRLGAARRGRGGLMKLTTAQNDRACGVLLASATGDALGAGYEFGSALVGPDGPAMICGGLGNFAPGEWTDDTSMTWAIAEVAAKGVDLRSPESLDDIARGFLRWYDSHPPDIGIQTSSVLGSMSRTHSLSEELAQQASRRETPGALADRMTQAAAQLHEQTGHTAGNGSLMRTAPVALAHLDDPIAIVEAAIAVSALTHTDPRAGEACALWSLAIHHAVLEDDLDIRSGLDYLPQEAQRFWAERIDEAESRDPQTFTPNGYVVTALQAAWSAIHHTPVPKEMPCLHLQDALATAIGIGDDTDTVAAIAGGLLGARWGTSAVPAAWRRILHGWPGAKRERLVELAQLAVTGGRPGPNGWPLADRIDYAGWVGRDAAVRHPHDEGVWLGGVGAFDSLPEDVTAVVSLCLVGSDQVTDGIEHVPFRLIDRPEPAENPNLAFVIDDAARTVQALRDEGHVVLLRCVAAQSRTPTVAIAYAMLRGMDGETAAKGVCSALPAASPNLGFRELVTCFDAGRAM